MVNSQYTASVFKSAFAVLGRDVDPLVVYPTQKHRPCANVPILTIACNQVRVVTK